MSFIIQPAGSFGTQSMTAGGTITANSPVVINSSGQVVNAGVTANATDVTIGPAAANLGAGITGGTTIEAGTALVQVNGTNAYVGTFNAGSGAITWGAGTAVPTGLTQIYGLVYAAASGKVVMTYKGTSGYIYAVVGTISGTTISFGTPTTIDSGGTAYGYSDELLVYNTTDGTVVAFWSYTAGANAYVSVGTVSGTTISFGTRYSFAVLVANASAITIGYQATGNKVLMIATDNGFAGWNMVAATISGSTMTLGAVTQYAAGGGGQYTMCVDTQRNQFIMMRSVGATNYIWAMSITGATTCNVLFNTTPATITTNYFLRYNSTNNVINLTGSTGGGIFQVSPFSNSGAAFTEGNASNLSPNYNSASFTYYSTQNIFIYVGGSTNNRISLVKNGLTNLTSNNYFGFATNAASLGGTVTVATVGAVATTSGLTPGSAYAISGLGYLSAISSTTAPTLGTYVGQALTSTTLLVKG